MGDIIDFIMSNFIIVLLVIGGLARVFGGNKDEEDKKANTNKPRQPVQTRQNSQGRPNERPIPSRPVASKTSASNQANTTIEEQQQKQLERLAGQMATGKVEDFSEVKKHPYNEENHHAFVLTQENREIEHKKDKQKVKNQLNKKLNRNGLINSIIMAEVLGPPRAIKPYKSVIKERKK